VNLFEDGKDLREATTNHINIDEAPKLHKAIIQHVLDTCPTRAIWAAAHPNQRPLTPIAAGMPKEETARTAGARMEAAAGKTVPK